MATKTADVTESEASGEAIRYTNYEITAATDAEFLPEVATKAAEDPLEIAVRNARHQAVNEYKGRYSQRKDKALVAINYLNCEYAGSSPKRVEVMSAAEAVLLDFFKAE